MSKRKQSKNLTCDGEKTRFDRENVDDEDDESQHGKWDKIEKKEIKHQ